MSTEPIVNGQRVDASSAELQLTIPHDLDYFRGHFPGAPIVPGVVQIKWAIELASRFLGAGGTFAGMDALKFQHVMRPGISVTLSLRWAAQDGKLHFAYQGDGARFGSGRLRFRLAP
jgi:3-hydroxymyristoyl/3-hydroxydecanoyl-(acyl carrier protein) dehydratase